MGAHLKSYFLNREGSIAMWSALAAMAAILGAGAAIDTHNMHSNQEKMQHAIDTAVLAAAIHPGTKKQKRTAGKDVFMENFYQHKNLSDPKVKFDISKKGIVTGTAEAKLSLYVMGMTGVKNPKLTSEAKAGRNGSGRSIEIAFVLDYSSSMEDQYVPMRDAAIDLINSLTDRGAKNNVKLALVPFAREVYAEMDGRYIVNSSPGVPWAGCTMSRDWPYVTGDQTPSLDVKSKWGLLDNDYGETLVSGYYDECSNYTDRGLVVRPLSTDHRGTKSQLRTMQPYSGTNITVGVNFGFQVLSPNAPWTEGAAYGSKTEKYMILLGDGSHNKEGFGPGNKYSESQGFLNLNRSCTAAKTAGITIMSIAYETDDDDNALKTCASGDTNFFQSDERNVDDIFEKIGEFIDGGDDIYLIR